MKNGPFLSKALFPSPHRLAEKKKKKKDKRKKKRKENLLKNMEYTAAGALSRSLNGEANLITVGLSGGVSYPLGMGRYLQEAEVQAAASWDSLRLRAPATRLSKASAATHDKHSIPLSSSTLSALHLRAGTDGGGARCRCVSG